MCGVGGDAFMLLNIQDIKLSLQIAVKVSKYLFWHSVLTLPQADNKWRLTGDECREKEPRVFNCSAQQEEERSGKSPDCDS